MGRHSRQRYLICVHTLPRYHRSNDPVKGLQNETLPDVEKDLQERLGSGVPTLYGATPDLMGPGRGLEIAAWLASQVEIVQGWAVVDDLGEEMDFVRQRFVKTIPSIGLDEIAADRLIELLKAP